MKLKRIKFVKPIHKFEVGDIVVGIGRRYGVTNADATMEVVSILTDVPEDNSSYSHDIEVKVLKQRECNEEVGHVYGVNSKHFKLIKRRR
jgi:hypothetical protein